MLKIFTVAPVLNGVRVSELSPEFTEVSANPPPAELLPDTARVAPVFVLVGVTNIDVIPLETDTAYNVVAESNTNPEAGALRVSAVSTALVPMLRVIVTMYKLVVVWSSAVTVT